MYQLAQLSIAQMRTPFEDPSMQDFVANLAGGGREARAVAQPGANP